MWAAVLTFSTASAVADDTDIFNTASATPKMLFVLDASGSMGLRDRTPNTRMQRLRSALSELLDGIENIDIGLMRFSKPVGGGPEVELVHPIVDIDIDANRASLQLAADNIPLGRLTAGGTPSVAALYESQRYFTGAAPYRGVTPDGAETYSSPVTSQCESNHIVLLTDGRPTPDNAAAEYLGPIYGPCETFDRGRGDCGKELATALATQDQFPGFLGVNTITTHSIGFNVMDSWISDIAQLGGGEYRDAESAAELVTAFQDILQITVNTAVASAPAVPISAYSESRHGNDLYYSFFQSADSPRWEGNIKKYSLNDGVIEDRYDQPVVVNGVVSPASTSLWATSADGATVASGGMAARKTASRRWLTDAGVTPEDDGTITPMLVDSAGSVARAYFNAASAAERNTLVSWVKGADSIDRDGDSNTTEANHYVADSLHGSPVLASYRVKESTDVLDQVLFTATNMGTLHAVNPETGDELWSYSPEELLPNIKKYVDNDSTSHIYGLDGQMVLHTTLKTTTSYDQEIDKAYLYLTQRRGGKNIFGLNVSNALGATDPLEVMWKITGGVAGTDFRNLGQTWSTPQMITIQHGCPNACSTRDALLFSGGYNPVYDNEDLTFPVTPDATGHGNAIYLVDPETGALLWSAGDGSHHDLNLPIKDSVPTTPIPVDSDADGFVNILFFSDIAGHVWRVDLNQAPDDLGDLAIAGGMIANLNEAGGKLRFFNRPDVVLTSTNFQFAKFGLVLGSGMRSSPLLTETQNNRLFTFSDPWVYTHPVSTDSSGNLISDYNYVKNADDTRSIITPADLKQYDPADDDSAPDYGFYLPLAAGEKILVETLTHAGRIFLTSYTPPAATASNISCEAYLGVSKLYILDLIKGSNLLPSAVGDPSVLVGVGIAPTPSIIDTGDSTGPVLVVGTTVVSLDTLLDGASSNAFRMMKRTGWSELNEY